MRVGKLTGCRSRCIRVMAISFQNEFRRFLKRYGVEDDERCVWDCAVAGVPSGRDGWGDGEPGLKPWPACPVPFRDEEWGWRAVCQPLCAVPSKDEERGRWPFWALSPLGTKRRIFHPQGGGWPGVGPGLVRGCYGGGKRDGSLKGTGRRGQGLSPGMGIT